MKPLFALATAVAALVIVGLALAGSRFESQPPLAQGDCPVHPSACAFATAIEQALISGQTEAILQQSQPSEYICPGPEPRGLGGPYPLCDGAKKGKERLGLPLLRLGSEGGVLSSEGYATFVQRWMASELWDTDKASLPVDEYGPTSPRLFSLGCPQRAAGRACADRFALLFSQAQQTRSQTPQPIRLQLIFFVERVRSGLRITAVASGPLAWLGDNPPLQAALRGGTATIAAPSGFQPFGVFYPWPLAR